MKKIISQEEYDKKELENKLLQEELNGLEPSDSFEYTKDTVILSEDNEVYLNVECNYKDWIFVKDSNKSDILELELLNEGYYHMGSIVLDNKQMKQLRDYLTHKIDYLEEC